jgi:hypothetical protein
MASFGSRLQLSHSSFFDSPSRGGASRQGSSRSFGASVTPVRLRASGKPAVRLSESHDEMSSGLKFLEEFTSLVADLPSME